MKKQIIFYFSLILVILFQSCSFRQQLDERNKLGKRLNPFFIKYYLKNPKDYSSMRRSRFKIECIQDSLKTEPKKNLMNYRVVYNDCYYKSNGKIGALLKFSVYETDSTWRFGSNFFTLYRFETQNPKFPLKNGLQVGSSLKDFKEVFGSFQKKGNQYLYEFIDRDYMKSRLILKVSNQTVIKLTIINKYNL